MLVADNPPRLCGLFILDVPVAVFLYTNVVELEENNKGKVK